MGKVDAKRVRSRLDKVIEEMKNQSIWDVPRPDDSAFVEMGAFGMNTMAFSQWLRWVFIPNVERMILAGGPWPHGSSVAVQAAREGDTDPSIAALVSPLSHFDDLFD
jgi:uncharacterized protein YqcC (DUF446 family)